MSWRNITDFFKRSHLALRAADRMGRGRGRLRFLDRLAKPAHPAPITPDLTDWHRHRLAAVWIGHATVLLRIGGLNILTDPVFSHRIGIGLGLITAGPARHVAPALRVDQLPRLDLILLTHAHFDHLDRPSLDRLPEHTPIITAPQTSDLIADLGFRDITELAWDRPMKMRGLQITARPARHWGARTFIDQYRGYNAYEMQSDTHRVLVGGDSAHHDLLKTLIPVDLAILGIGAYDPYIAAHATPEQAWKMANDAGAARLLPIHHSTFNLSHEPMDEPMRRLRAVAADESRRIVVTAVGGQWAAE